LPGQFAPAQTAAPAPPYTVVDSGPSYRVWQRTIDQTDPVTGQVSPAVQSYTELADGMNYWSNGQWAESQDLIEATPTGAQAVHGQVKATINGDITSSGAITLTTPSGQVFQSRPLGLYYADPVSGKVAQIALVQPGPGLLYAPNVLVFTNCLSGLAADLMLVWARNGFEQNLVLRQAPPAPESFGLSSASCRLQMWTAMDQCPEPLEVRPAPLASGLVDHILIFPDCWFPVGSASLLGAAPLAAAGQAAAVRPVCPSDTNTVPTAKSLVAMAGQTVLVEEISFSDLLPAFKALSHASLSPGKPRAVELAARGQLLPPRAATRQNHPVLPAPGRYAARGVLLDYVQLSGSSNSYTFTDGTTYYVPSSYTVTSGSATFQAGTVLKFATNAYLMASGPVSFPAGGSQVVFTSVDDNDYGQPMPGSTGQPYHTGNPALWMYWQTVNTAVQDALFRWVQQGVVYGEGTVNEPSLSSSAFQDCTIGVSLWLPDDTLYLSSDTYCNVTTPVNCETGTVSGSMANVCASFPVASLPPNAGTPGTGGTAIRPQNAGGSGQVDSWFCVEFDNTSSTNVTVNYAVSGTALSGTDYTAHPVLGSVAVPAGVSYAQVTLSPEYRASAGFDVVATFTLLPGDGYQLGTSDQTVSIPIMDNFSTSTTGAAGSTISLVASNIIGITDIDYFPPSNCLILSMNWYYGSPYNFALLAPNGSLTQWSSVSGLQLEANIATVKSTAGGFTSGYTYFIWEEYGQIGWVSANGTTEDTGNATGPFWSSVPTAPGEGLGDLYFDQTGVWGNNLIVVETEEYGVSGGVYTVDSAGTATLIASVPTGFNEGLLTVPNNPAVYGPWAGQLITSDEMSLTIYSISTSGAVQTWNIGVTGQKFLVIPANQNLYCMDAPYPGYLGCYVFKVPEELFASHVGDILAFQSHDQSAATFPQALYIIHWNGSSFVTYPLFFDDIPSLPAGIIERGAFAPY
jgi:hypothetical protein